MPKHPSGTPGKKPPAPSVKARLDRKTRQDGERVSQDAQAVRRPEPVPMLRGRS